MTPVFEHLMTLGSFILALSLATILMFLATLAHKRKQAKLSTPHLLWMAAIFVNQINFWLGSYALRHITHATYVSIAFVIVFPVLLYLQSALVVADNDGPLDMPAHHASNKHYYIGLVATASALDAIYFLYTAAQNPGFDISTFLIADGLLIATALLAIFNNNRAIQLGVPAFHLVARVFGFVLSSYPLIAPS
jgi:hypothetical protein